MKNAVLIYPHQLFKNNLVLSLDKIIILIEDPLYFSQFNFHKQKLIFHRASMKNYERFLIEKGHTVKYIEFSKLDKSENIFEILHKNKVQKVYYFDTVDFWLEKAILKGATKHKIEIEKYESPMFLNTSIENKNYFENLKKTNKKLFMKTFYEWQRKRLNILINENKKPIGGKWSFDSENRKKLPKNIELPPDFKNQNNEFITEAKKYIEKNFPNNYGETKNFIYPIDFIGAEKQLKNFIKEKINNFGPYEDAVTTKSNFVFHSVLSPLLNVGLLTPKQIIDEVLKHQDEINIASLEGFIRQIIGWREFIRLTYQIHGVKIRNSNYFKHKRKVSKKFWSGETKIEPIDDTIKNVSKFAYTHHIPRLMVMGNFMNLCELDPNEIYKWFMELFIDAYDWVMVPNIYSMALYADGGLITTKPYISSSRYVISMSDYKKGKWSEIWDALFWNFVSNNFEKLDKENRLGYIGLIYKKMSKEKMTEYRKIAKDFLCGL